MYCLKLYYSLAIVTFLLAVPVYTSAQSNTGDSLKKTLSTQAKFVATGQVDNRARSMPTGQIPNRALFISTDVKDSAGVKNENKTNHH